MNTLNVGAFLFLFFPISIFLHTKSRRAKEKKREKMYGFLIYDLKLWIGLDFVGQNILTFIRQTLMLFHLEFLKNSAVRVMCIILQWQISLENESFFRKGMYQWTDLSSSSHFYSSTWNYQILTRKEVLWIIRIMLP